MTLRVIKLVHTIAWIFFASCILAIPFFAWRNDYRAAFVLIGVVAVEVFVLLLNGWHCPLTPVAARYTTDRRDNFDIYLPAWLARHNKLIFGALYVVGIAYTIARWSDMRH